VMEHRCLRSLKDMLGPERHDVELDSRLEKLSYLDSLAKKVVSFVNESKDLRTTST